jgi:hypothetical protein
VGAGGVNLVVSLVSLMTRSFQLRSHRWKIIFAGERIKIPKQARARFKSGHQGVETGQYPQARKEHIANGEQIVYILPMLDSGLRRPIFRMSEGRIPP